MITFSLRRIKLYRLPYLYINIRKKCFSIHPFSCPTQNHISLNLKKKIVHINFYYFLTAARSISTTCYLFPEDGWGDKVFFQASKKGKYGRKDEKTSIEHWRAGVKELRSEIKLWQHEVKEKFIADPILVRPGDMDKFFELNSEDDLKKWIVTSDKDHKEGNSTASLTLSPNKCGLFKGFIDIRVPSDGKVNRAGYCNINTIPATKSFKRDTHYNWELYTHLTMRIRGDGRSYLIIIGTAGTFDITWSDAYSYVLFTRGGPYWQDVKIPFSKFLLGHSGCVQDKQSPIPLYKIQRFGLTAADRVTAPFYLEIDYIGLLCDPSHKEEFAYEMYKVPQFWSS